MKFDTVFMQEEIRKASTPAKPKRLGSRRDVRIRKDWNKKRDEIMRAVLAAKFTQHDDIRGILINTGDARLIEESKDTYWGEGLIGQGKNKLGVLLMELRSKLRQPNANIIASTNKIIQ